MSDRYDRDHALQQRISRTVLTDPEAAKHYSWIVRNRDDEPWTLLTYRWTSLKDALETAGHWSRHYEQVKTVEVVERWTAIEANGGKPT